MNPVPGHKITTPFGRRGHLWSLGFHTGADLAADKGTPIVAAQAGRVIAANAYDRSYGYKVIILNDAGEQIWYCHMPWNKAKVKVGQRVAEGQPIGVVGNTGNVTGPHLHMERRRAPYSFEAKNFLDPAPIITAKPGKPDKMDPGSYYLGAKGDHILWLGQRLIAHGYPKKYTATDTFTKADVAAVKWWQNQLGYSGRAADGFPGAHSLRELALEPLPERK
jgi:murein DD-endopeptidase MepM/ murein hydrolase activator NlpD